MQSNEEIQGNLAPVSRESNSESCTMYENARSAFQEGRQWMKLWGNGPRILKAHEEIAKILRNEPHTLLVKALK
jgi:hypothetical protein